LSIKKYPAFLGCGVKENGDRIILFWEKKSNPSFFWKLQVRNNRKIFFLANSQNAQVIQYDKDRNVSNGWNYYGS